MCQYIENKETGYMVTKQLPDFIVEKMREQLKKTHTTNKEYGFNICLGEQKFVLSIENECGGEDCGIRLRRECTIPDTKLIGSYHTRHDAPANMSTLDIYNMCQGNYVVQCIGTTIDNSIKCYVQKKGINIDECIRDIDISKYDSLMNEKHVLWASKESTDPNLFKLKVEQFKKKAFSHNDKMARVANKYFDTICVQ